MFNIQSTLTSVGGGQCVSILLKQKFEQCKVDTKGSVN